MNENEKMELSNEQTSPLSSAEEKNLPMEQAACEAACAETESPALDLAEVADKQTDDKVDYHSMSKEQLLDHLKEILAADNMQAHKDVNYMKQCFFTLRKAETDKELLDFIDAGNQLEAFSATPDPVEAEFQKCLADFKERRAAYLEAEENRKQSNLAKKLTAIEGIKSLMGDVDNINRNYAEFQKLQQDFKDIKEIPQQSETEIWTQYQKVVEEFYDLLKLNKELRDLDFKKNLEAKQELVAEAKSLVDADDVVEASHKLQELHSRWREIGPVAKEIREEIWEEFRNASTIINRRHQEYFEQRKAEEQKNEEAKIKLCEEVEALSTDNLKTFPEWDAVTEKIKELQASWKKIGFASRKNNNALFARFRKPIDDFFARKNEFYKKVRDEFRENLEKKNALCEKAEKLAESDDLIEATRVVKELQEEWKTIGSVERKQSDLVWKRFKTACNTVFDHRRKLSNEKKAEENSNLEAKQQVIADLKSIYEETEETGDSIRRVRALQEKWRGIGFVPIAKKEALQEEYRDIVGKLTAKLNMGASRRERGNRQGRQSYTINPNSANPKAELNDLIRQLKSELQTYENNLGFFNVKSSAGNSMVNELQRKIDNIKGKVAELEKNLKALKAEEKAGEEN